MSDLYINVSPATHILPNGDMNFTPVVVQPNEIFDRRQTNLDVDKYSSFRKFNIKEIYGHENLTLVREFALGDLIMLIPVARNFKRQKNIKNLFIATSERFIKPLKTLFPDLEFLKLSACDNKKHGLQIHLNGILECDHSLNNEQRNLHRMDIYANFLNTKIDKLDWSSQMQTKGKLFINPKENTIALQIRGSGYMKTLPYEFVQRMATSIAAKGFKVLLIDQDASKGFEDHNIINACGKMTVIDIIENLKHCKCVLTMDSGVLWLAHVAACPVITFLGSTREHERMTLHPLYPEKARTIDLATHIGCTPCFETRARCKGTIDCMNKFNHDTILNEVHRNLDIILKGV